MTKEVNTTSCSGLQNEPIYFHPNYMAEHLTPTKEERMPKMPKWRRPDALVKLLWTLIEQDKAVLFVEKMKITPSTFYRWLNGTRYPCLENCRRINKAMRTKQFLNFDHNVLPE